MALTKEQQKAKTFLLNLTAEISEMQKAGVPNKTIVSNINFMVEPIVGFANALKISDHVSQFLKQKKDVNFAAYFIRVSKGEVKS